MGLFDFLKPKRDVLPPHSPREMSGGMSPFFEAMRPTTQFTDKVQVCAIFHHAQKRAVVLGDRFTPTEFIVNQLRLGGFIPSGITGKIDVRAAERSFDVPSERNEKFVIMYAQSEFGDWQDAGYRVVVIGQRGQVWLCPQCGALLKKGNLGMAASAAGSGVAGEASCDSCRAKLSQSDVYNGKYDL